MPESPKKEKWTRNGKDGQSTGQKKKGLGQVEEVMFIFYKDEICFLFSQNTMAIPKPPLSRNKVCSFSFYSACLSSAYQI